MGKKKAASLVGVQLFSKLIGVIREIILANFFGPIVIFSDYLKLISFH